MITLNIVNLIGAGVMMIRLVVDTWSSLTIVHDARTNLALLYAEEELAMIKYIDGITIKANFRAKVNDQGASINNRYLYAYIIKLMPGSCAAFTRSLLHASTSAEVIVQLSTHALLLHGLSAVALVKSMQELAHTTGMGKYGMLKPKL